MPVRSVGALATVVMIATAVLPAGAEIGANQVFDPRNVQTACPPAADHTRAEECTPLAFSKIGSVERRQFFYGLYRHTGKESVEALARTGLVVFEHVAGGRLRAVIAIEGDPAVSFDKPALLRSRGRVLLHIPAAESGTGNFNRERPFVWRAQQWRPVDTTSWLDELQHRLPTGMGVWKGIYPDYCALRAATPAWRDGDSNACPTGGRLELVLGWRGDAIGLEAIHRKKAGECGEPLAVRPLKH